VSVFVTASSPGIFCNWIAAAWFLWPMEASSSSFRFAAVYFAAGTAGTLAGAIHTATVTTAPSGGVFGVVGAYITVVAIYWTRIGLAIKRNFLLHVRLMPIAFIALSFLPGVD
jgi:membrane associated rhomboid family serine protease